MGVLGAEEEHGGLGKSATIWQTSAELVDERRRGVSYHLIQPIEDVLERVWPVGTAIGISQTRALCDGGGRLRFQRAILGCLLQKFLCCLQVSTQSRERGKGPIPDEAMRYQR